MLELFIKGAIEWTYLNTNWLWFVPLVSGIIGWLTNLLALKMMFYPLDFRGIGRLGWQGVVLSRATQMAETAVILMLEQVIDLSKQFARLNSQKIIELHKNALKQEMEIAIEQAFLTHIDL